MVPSKGLKKQSGAAMVETAMTLVLYLAITFAIFDFSLLIFKWAKGKEVLRHTVRTLIVSDPLSPEIMDELKKNCVTPEPFYYCSGGDDDSTAKKCLDDAQRLIPDILGKDIKVTYSCSLAGADDRPVVIPAVRVDLTLKYKFLLPKLLGFGDEYSLERILTLSRTGEDMDTVAP